MRVVASINRSACSPSKPDMTLDDFGRVHDAAGGFGGRLDNGVQFIPGGG